ncbi:hypothetical protein U1Q18_025768 [Sarracenia purpurea var. burkii]
MAHSNLFISYIIILSIISLTSSSSSSIYDALRSYGLPTGVLPKGITNFTIDAATGRFEARLDEACNARFETHVHFDWNVSGTLGHGEIRRLSGVSAQDLFLWFPVLGIRVDIPSSGLIYFDVGVIRKQFSLSFFETPRDCTATDPNSPPVDIVLFDTDNRIVKNQHRRTRNEIDLGHQDAEHGYDI